MLKMVGYFLAPILSVLVTFLTGFSGFYDQGVPLSWRNMIVCPGPGMEIACYVLMFNWIAFALDALFYTAIGYGLLVGSKRLLRQFHPMS